MIPSFDALTAGTLLYCLSLLSNPLICFSLAHFSAPCFLMMGCLQEILKREDLHELLQSDTGLLTAFVWSHPNFNDT